jgi:hypothetical protein
MKYGNQNNDLLENVKDTYSVFKEKYGSLVKKGRNLFGALALGVALTANPFVANAKSSFDYKTNVVPRKFSLQELSPIEKDVYNHLGMFVENKDKEFSSNAGKFAFQIYSDLLGNKDSVISHEDGQNFVPVGVYVLGLLADKYLGNDNKVIDNNEMDLIPELIRGSGPLNGFVEEMYNHGLEPNSQIPRSGTAYEGLTKDQKIVFDYIGDLIKNDDKSAEKLSQMVKEGVREIADKIGIEDGHVTCTELKQFYDQVGTLLPLKVNELYGDGTGKVGFIDVNQVGRLAKEYKGIETLLNQMWENKN